MNIEYSRLAGIVAASLMLASCASNMLFEEPGDATFGEANRQTMMAQVIDPDPQYDELVPVSSGEHAAAAVERYRTDKVKQPDTISTSTTSSGPN
ncbi:hypothetical protein [Allopontixanthobacter sp.]|uniref:hypothetical protein n=1 Tax=Allopontixanthobacter sp. TaxID=2906452 RepID=UPI002AB8DE7D|nr:hypothetical protein [Allopontixanthobacter sp.]MDZ4306999.1 hypothetical protein [Allopontixanthobacter sp.]